MVQSWRSNEESWLKTHYSTSTIDLEPIENGTLLKFKQTHVPISSYKSVKKGWNEYCLSPLKNLFEK
ncbi:MAG: SRPBCC domain-containing protein [Candidatus Hodarchaeota archaeon]